MLSFRIAVASLGLAWWAPALAQQPQVVQPAARAVSLAPNPGGLPLLGDSGMHLYVQEAYEGFSPAVTAAVAGRYDELVGAGMDTARHLFDWADLEPSPGIYDLGLVIEAMDERRAAGIEHQFCNLVVVDSGGPVVPGHVQDWLDAGFAWDDARITDAFQALLDAVVPVMLARDMYLLGLANEPGGYLDEQPGLAASFAGFLEPAVARAHALAPELACTVVFAGPDDPSLSALMPLCDVASFNFYMVELELVTNCLFGSVPLPLYRSYAPSEVGGSLDDLIAAAQGKLVCIQEIGQSTGWMDQPQTLGPLAGLMNQADCYLALAQELLARKQHFRTVCAWTLNDHTMAGIGYVGDALEAEGLPACFADNFDEIFGPTGLVRSDSTASRKPAFEVFKAGVSLLEQTTP